MTRREMKERIRELEWRMARSEARFDRLQEKWARWTWMHPQSDPIGWPADPANWPKAGENGSDINTN